MLIFISAIAAFAVVVGAYFCISFRHKIENDRLAKESPEIFGDYSHWYYDRLTKGEQLIYNALLEAVSSYADTTEVIECDEDVNALSRAAEALTYDRPELIVLSCASFTLEKGWGDIRIDIEYSCTLEEIEKCISEVESRINDIVASLPEERTDYQTVEYFHDIITSECECRASQQDEKSFYFDSAYALCGAGSSAGYSMAMNILCRTAGLDCISVYGKYNDENHMWNIVCCGGVMLHVDTAADDATLTFAPNMSFHGYLGLSDSEMLADHSADESFALPICGESGHDYYTNSGLFASTLNEAKEIIKSETAKAADNGNNFIELYASFNCDADDISDAVISVISSESSSIFKPVCRVIGVRGNAGAYNILLFTKNK